jgi:SAM-dependent methyltransferase
MTEVGGIIGLATWLKTPPGRYLLAWEQAQLDRCVVDVFGFHALQLGLPELDALRDNRMPHRWLAVDHTGRSGDATEWPPGPKVPPGNLPRAVVLACDFDALPFDTHSLDLIVLPHTLELSADPHRALSEVERVLVPEGRVVVLGFNPSSLWGLRLGLGRLLQRLGGRAALFMPKEGSFLGYWRLRDWLRLLSFDIELGRFGCHGLPLRSERGLTRFEWVARLGQRWWPVFGSVYVIVAVKRVRGMRLVGLARQPRSLATATAPAVSQRSPTSTTSTTTGETS